MLDLLFRVIPKSKQNYKGNRNPVYTAEKYMWRMRDGITQILEEIHEDSRKIFEDDLFIVIRDVYPVTNLHTLLIPKRHVPSYFDLSEQELIRLQGLIEDQKNLILKEDKEVTAFNIGINDGIDAGQTILHSHIHLIPRRAGDTKNPRGGVRGVIPKKQSY